MILAGHSKGEFLYCEETDQQKSSQLLSMCLKDREKAVVKHHQSSPIYFLTV